MTTQELLLKVANELPAGATMLDAIHQLELLAVLNDSAAEVLCQPHGGVRTRAPEWLYESPSRLSTVLHQSCKGRPFRMSKA